MKYKVIIRNNKILFFYVDGDGVLLDESFKNLTDSISTSFSPDALKIKQKIILDKNFIKESSRSLSQAIIEIIQVEKPLAVYFKSISNRRDIISEFKNRANNQSSLFMPVLKQFVDHIKFQIPNVKIELITQTFADLNPTSKVKLNPEQIEELKSINIAGWNTQNASHFTDVGKLDLLIHHAQFSHERVNQDFPNDQLEIKGHVLDDMIDILKNLHHVSCSYPALIPAGIEISFHHKQAYNTVKPLELIGKVKGSGKFDPDYRMHVKVLPELSRLKKAIEGSQDEFAGNLVQSLCDSLPYPIDSMQDSSVYSIQHYLDYITKKPLPRNTKQEIYDKQLELLYSSFNNNRLIAFKKIIKNYPEITKQVFGSLCDTLLIICIKENWIQEAEYLIINGVDVHQKNILDFEALHFLSKESLLKKLLSQSHYNKPNENFTSSDVGEINYFIINHFESTDFPEEAEEKLKNALKKDPELFQKIDPIYGNTILHAVFSIKNELLQSYLFEQVTTWNEMENIFGEIPENYLPNDSIYKKIPKELDKKLFLSFSK